MTILFRYILQECVKIFVMCFAGLMTVYLVVDFFEKVRGFIRHDPAVGAILLYFLFKCPAIAAQMAPLAVLMATLLTVSVMARNHELTAMRSCGIGPLWIASPFLAFAFAVGLTLFGLSAVVGPLATAQADYVKAVLIEKKPVRLTAKSHRPWVQADNQSLMNVDDVDPDTAVLRGVSVYRLDPSFRLSEIFESREARYTERGWHLEKGIRRTLLPSGAMLTESFEEWPIAISQRPEDFKTLFSTKSEELTLFEIKAQANRLRRDGYGYARPLTDYYMVATQPLIPVVMAIVGLALSLGLGGRRGTGIALGIGQALAIGFLYWTTQSVSVALGRSGVLAPLIAGSVAHLLFLSLGGYLFLRLRQ